MTFDVLNEHVEGERHGQEKQGAADNDHDKVMHQHPGLPHWRVKVIFADVDEGGHVDGQGEDAADQDCVVHDFEGILDCHKVGLASGDVLAAQN